MSGATLVRRHLAVFILVVAVPVAGIILTISFLFREEIVRIARSRTIEAVERSLQNLETEALGFALFTSALVNDRNLMEHARVYTRTGNLEERFSAANGIERSISWFFRITSRIGSVFLFFPDGKNFYYSNYPASNIDMDKARSLCFAPGQPAGEVWCLDDTATLPGSVEQPPVITMAVRPRPNDLRKSGIEAIMVSFRIPFLDRMYAGVGTDGGVSYLVNREGTVILSNRRENTGRAFAEVTASFDGRYLVAETVMESTGWTYAEAIPYRYFTRNVELMMRYVYAALALVLLLFILYTLAFFAGIINPLRSVTAQMSRVAAGDFTVQVRESGPAEFRSLGAAFNVMVGRLAELTRQILAEHEERTKVEIEALRYQLNPHFVCNTLNAIGMMASIAKADSIRRMTAALTRIMRETLSADNTILALGSELKNLESYVYIMKIRFGDSFSFHTEVEAGLLPAGIPTMLLQPLVENAVLHGLRGLPPGHGIVVSARREGGFVRLQVKDDGAGIPPGRMERLFDPARENRGGLNRIGLHNVRRRIQLSYGPPCDLSVESRPGEGTTVRLLIPLLTVPQARKTETA